MIDDKTPQRPDGLAGDEPHFASHSEPTVETTVMPAMHTETRTVVKTKSRKLPIFLASLLGLAVGSVLVIALVMSGAFRITGTNVESAVSGATQTIEIDPEDTTLSEAVAAKALPSVVSITAQGETEDSGGIGSGVILDTDGNILTNYHVIEGASALVARTDSGDSYEPRLWARTSRATSP